MSRIDHVTIADRVIAEFNRGNWEQHYLDMLTLLQQLGAFEPVPAKDETAVTSRA